MNAIQPSSDRLSGSNIRHRGRAVAATFRRTVARFVIVIAFALAVVSGSGCSQSPPPPPKPVIPLATELRVLQPGDNWVYKGEEEFRFNDTGKSVTLQVTRTVSVIQTTLDGKPFLATSSSGESIAPNGYKNVTSWLYYFTQDPKTRDVWEQADTRGKDGTLRTLAKPSRGLIGTWSANKTHTTEDSYSNGDQAKEVVAVTGTEEVETPFARITCWKVTITGTTTEDGKTSNFRQTVWIAPQLGRAVKGEYTSTSIDRTVTGKLLLMSTNVDPKD